MKKRDFAFLTTGAGSQLLQSRATYAFSPRLAPVIRKAFRPRDDETTYPLSRWQSTRVTTSGEGPTYGNQPLHMTIDESKVAEAVQFYPSPSMEVPLPDLSVLRPFELMTNDLQSIFSLPSAEVESKLFKDLSHIFLDLIIFLQPDTYLLRLAIVMGQIFNWASNLVVNKTINPDDLFFQLITFPISLFLLYRSIWPIFQASCVELEPLDIIACNQLFDPVGVSFLQFKVMKATGALEWVTVEPGTILVDENDVLGKNASSTKASDDLGNPVYFKHGTAMPYVEQEGCSRCLYWLYKGDVKVSYNGKVISYMERNNGRFIDDPNSSGLLADMRFLYEMDEKAKGIESKSQTNYQNRILNFFQRPSNASVEADHNNMPQEGCETIMDQFDSGRTTYPMMTMVMGEKGGTLLRIDSHKILELMENDDYLSDSMRRLMLKSLQRKLGHLLDSQTRTQRDECDWSKLDELDDEDDFIPEKAYVTSNGAAKTNGLSD